MPLYLLRRVPSSVCWDEYRAKLIRARSEADARAMANEQTGGEGRIWATDKVFCETIAVGGEAKIIITDYNAG